MLHSFLSPNVLISLQIVRVDALLLSLLNITKTSAIYFQIKFHQINLDFFMITFLPQK